MNLDERLVRAMEARRTPDELCADLNADYMTVIFGLERLKKFGFVREDLEGYFRLTRLGKRLRVLLESRPSSPS